MDRALFVAHQNVLDVVLLENLVIDRKDSAARIAEYRIHALILQSLNHHFRTGHLPRHVSLRLGRFARLACRGLQSQKSPRWSSGGAWGTIRGPLPSHAPMSYNDYEVLQGRLHFGAGSIRSVGEGRQRQIAPRLE